MGFEKRELILINLIWNVDSKQSKINKAMVKTMFYCKNCNIIVAYTMPDAYLQPYEKSKMECFAKIIV